MPIADSIAGRLGTAIWDTNPMVGLGLSFGVGSGVYAGAHTFATTDGDFFDKSNAARRSGGNYLLYGGLGMAATLTYGPGMVPGGVRGAGRAAKGFGLGIKRDYERGRRAAVREAIETDEVIADSYKFRGMMGGMRRVAESKLLMAGAGAAVGSAIGASLDKKDPERGARRGALLGGGGGVALATGLHASRLWGGLNPIAKTGAIGLLSAAAFGGAALMSNRGRYAAVDQAVPEDGMRGRMNTIGAEGDLVFGLHNSR